MRIKKLEFAPNNHFLFKILSLRQISSSFNGSQVKSFCITRSIFSVDWILSLISGYPDTVTVDLVSSLLRVWRLITPVQILNLVSPTSLTILEQSNNSDQSWEKVVFFVLTQVMALNSSMSTRHGISAVLNPFHLISELITYYNLL